MASIGQDIHHAALALVCLGTQQCLESEFARNVHKDVHGFIDYYTIAIKILDPQFEQKLRLDLEELAPKHERLMDKEIPDPLGRSETCYKYQIDEVLNHLIKNNREEPSLPPVEDVRRARQNLIELQLKVTDKNLKMKDERFRSHHEAIWKENWNAAISEYGRHLKTLRSWADDVEEELKRQHDLVMSWQ